jgi:hypothetical protein
MELALPPSIPPSGAQRTSRVYGRSVGSLQIQSCTPFGEPRSTASTQRSATLGELTDTDPVGPSAVCLAVCSLGRLTLRALHSQSGYRHCAASQRLPALLDMESPLQAGWEASGSERPPPSHRRHSPSPSPPSWPYPVAAGPRFVCRQAQSIDGLKEFQMGCAEFRGA